MFLTPTAGVDLYSLSSEEARKTGETAKGGIQSLLKIDTAEGASRCERICRRHQTGQAHL